MKKLLLLIITGSLYSMDYKSLPHEIWQHIFSFNTQTRKVSMKEVSEYFGCSDHRSLDSILPKTKRSFSKLCFLWKDYLLLGLTLEGDLYTICVDKNKAEAIYFKQEFPHKAKILDFAVNIMNAHQFFVVTDKEVYYGDFAYGQLLEKPYCKKIMDTIRYYKKGFKSASFVDSIVLIPISISNTSCYKISNGAKMPELIHIKDSFEIIKKYEKWGNQ